MWLVITLKIKGISSGTRLQYINIFPKKINVFGHHCQHSADFGRFRYPLIIAGSIWHTSVPVCKMPLDNGIYVRFKTFLSRKPIHSSVAMTIENYRRSSSCLFHGGRHVRHASSSLVAFDLHATSGHLATKVFHSKTTHSKTNRPPDVVQESAHRQVTLPVLVFLAIDKSEFQLSTVMFVCKGRWGDVGNVKGDIM